MAKRMLMTTVAPGSQKRRSSLLASENRAWSRGERTKGLRDRSAERTSFDFRGGVLSMSNSPRAFPATGHFFARYTARWVEAPLPPSVAPFLVAIRPVGGIERIHREIITAKRPGRMCNQRSLMAPHYAKRRAKGAWHFLSRWTKNQERPIASCGRAHFLLVLIGERDAAARRRRRRGRRRLPRR